MSSVKTFQASEFDLFYISYDEPQKEEFWASLLAIAPWAKRIDGVKGFDSAHKAAANQSETEKFITVDGDNLVFPEFFDQQLEIPPELDDCVLSWNSVNVINGLVYGNGGLKLWNKDFVLNMKTHENAIDDAEKVDFCWKDKYVQLRNVFSETNPNGSPFQAFRAGFREGVKMTLDRGSKIDPVKIKNFIWKENLRRLLIWASVGSDVENGVWAIYGCRLGMYLTNLTSNFDMTSISDYDWFKSYFFDEILPEFQVAETSMNSTTCTKSNITYDQVKLREKSTDLAIELRKGLGIDIADLDPEQSKFFKATQPTIFNSTKDPLVKE